MEENYKSINIEFSENDLKQILYLHTSLTEEENIKINKLPAFIKDFSIYENNNKFYKTQIPFIHDIVTSAEGTFLEIIKNLEFEDCLANYYTFINSDLLIDMNGKYQFCFSEKKYLENIFKNNEQINSFESMKSHIQNSILRRYVVFNKRNISLLNNEYLYGYCKDGQFIAMNSYFFVNDPEIKNAKILLLFFQEYSHLKLFICSSYYNLNYDSPLFKNHEYYNFEVGNLVKNLIGV